MLNSWKADWDERQFVKRFLCWNKLKSGIENLKDLKNIEKIVDFIHNKAFLLVFVTIFLKLHAKTEEMFVTIFMRFFSVSKALLVIFRCFTFPAFNNLRDGKKHLWISFNYRRIISLSEQNFCKESMVLLRAMRKVHKLFDRKNFRINKNDIQQVDISSSSTVSSLRYLKVKVNKTQ